MLLLLLLPLPAHSSAKKLVSLPGSRGPVWPVLNCLLKEGAKRKEEVQKTVVVALRSLAGVLCVDVCQLLQPAVENMVEDVCRVKPHPLGLFLLFTLLLCSHVAIFHGPVSADQAAVL